jgi:peroxiredoxin
VQDRTPPFTTLAEAFEAAMAGDGPVNQRLAMFADTLRALDPGFTAVVDRLVGRLNAVRAGAAAPAPGEPMPEFILPDEDGRLVLLSSLLARGPVAVAFHRGHWCPYCRITARALTQAHAQLSAAGGTLVAITPDRASFVAKLREFSGATYPILTDVDNGYALSLNLAIWVGTEMQDKMLEFGVELEAYQGNASWMLPIPATFVVGSDGLVKARFIDPDYRRRMDVGELLDSVRQAR